MMMFRCRSAQFPAKRLRCFLCHLRRVHISKTSVRRGSTILGFTIHRNLRSVKYFFFSNCQIIRFYSFVIYFVCIVAVLLAIINLCPGYIRFGLEIPLLFTIFCTVVLNLFAILYKVSPFCTI